MRTLTAYGIGVVIVLAILNAILWRAGTPPLHEVNVFSAGFILGMLGMYIAAWLYGLSQGRLKSGSRHNNQISVVIEPGACRRGQRRRRPETPGAPLHFICGSASF